MIDRKALIKEAAKAMVALAPGENWEDCDQEWYLRDAAAALAVFEKAHTPTDDERARVLSILADMDYNDGGMMRWSSGRPTEQAEKVADRIVRELAGFRRSEVPEPSAEAVTAYDYNPQEALLRDLYSLRGWSGGDAATRVEIIDRAMAFVIAHPEPQVEPSGAQVEKVARVLFGATVDSMLVARELAAIALRAASETGGEGR